MAPPCVDKLDKDQLELGLSVGGTTASWPALLYRRVIWEASHPPKTLLPRPITPNHYECLSEG